MAAPTTGATQQLPPPPRSQPPSRPDPSWEPPPPRERSILGRITMAVLLMSLGAAFILDQADLIDLTARDVFATALIVVGAGLVVGTWIGRARWLIVLGFLLTPFVIFASFLHAVDVPLGDGLGERNYTVSSVASLRDEYQLGAGQLNLDLRDLELDATTPAAVSASVGAGQLVVRVPSDVTVVVEAQAAIGELDLLGEVRDEGTRLDRTLDSEGVEGAGRLTLDLGVGAGQIVVERDPRVPPPTPLDPEPTAPADEATSEQSPATSTEQAPADSTADQGGGAEEATPATETNEELTP